jgi:hypothetical protein
MANARRNHTNTNLVPDRLIEFESFNCEKATLLSDDRRGDFHESSRERIQPSPDRGSTASARPVTSKRVGWDGVVHRNPLPLTVLVHDRGSAGSGAIPGGAHAPNRTKHLMIHL